MSAGRAGPADAARRLPSQIGMAGDPQHTDPHVRAPTWREAFTAALIAGAVFFAVLLLLGDLSTGAAAGRAAIVFVVSVPGIYWARMLGYRRYLRGGGR